MRWMPNIGRRRASRLRIGSITSGATRVSTLECYVDLLVRCLQGCGWSRKKRARAWFGITMVATRENTRSNNLAVFVCNLQALVASGNFG